MALSSSSRDVETLQHWNTSRDEEVPEGLDALPSALTEIPFLGASDAAFADDPSTRRSSQGYLFICYGMPIEWKATLQKCVTKSTTEAELISLSVMAGEWQWWHRFFQRIHFSLDTEVSLFCDNQQTVRAVTTAEEKLQTKLKYVAEAGGDARSRQVPTKVIHRGDIPETLQKHIDENVMDMRKPTTPSAMRLGWNSRRTRGLNEPQGKEMLAKDLLFKTEIQVLPKVMFARHWLPVAPDKWVETWCS